MSLSQKLLFLTFPGFLLLGGCFWSSSDTTAPTSGSIASTSGSTESLSWTNSMTETPSLADCKSAVDEYLMTTKTLQINTSKKIVKNTPIVVDYIGRLADGTVFDTSVESVAKACGLYTAQRNYAEWLEFTAWAWQMIAGFDAGVIGMSTNETKTITISSKDAYGDATVSYPIAQLQAKPDGSAYAVGESIMTMNGAVKIESLTDKEFTIKNNHPLAGKDLIFDITIKVIK